MYKLKTGTGLRKSMVIQNSSLSAQDLTTTQADLTGTEVAYTCETNASYIVYEITAQWNHLHTSTYDHIYFWVELWEKVGDTWSSMGAGYRWTEIFIYLKGQDVMHATFRLPSYTGERSYKLRVRAYSGRRPTFNEDEEGNTYDLIVKMYSVL
tara:strand:+ start:1175 stop:1633 length:459 start_codon:yes stop_codon:yes gene_type:complete